MRIDVLTLFPDMFPGFVDASIVGRAVSAGIVEIGLTDIRNFSTDRHRSVDDKPFGGGPGMVMMCGPVFDAVEHVRGLHADEPVLVMLTPQGDPLTQRLVEELTQVPRVALLCGHYEGFDERIRQGLSPREISIGDYVLSGGEPAAIVLIDALVRLLPGALGSEESTVDESFSSGTLEYPHYTRPRSFRGMDVPEVLLSGDHARIEQWRRASAIERTRRRRPDLLAGRDGGAE
jgi:tRNA (guanine37-N1)-methyltransferase